MTTYNRCWYTLKVDTSNALSPHWSWPVPTHPFHQCWIYPAKDIFNPDWIEYTKSLGLTLRNSMVFYKNNCVSSSWAHVDTYTSDPSIFANFGLNWVIGGAGSKMIWYKLPKEIPTVKWTETNTPYITWPTSELTVVEEHEITNNLTLVRTGIPHDVYNVKIEPRWCISARLEIPTGTSWEYIVDYMRSKNLLVEN